MESRLNHDSDRIEVLEKKLKEANSLASESDRKFEEVSKSIYQSKINQFFFFVQLILKNK